jgi:ribosome recycling factor
MIHGCSTRYHSSAPSAFTGIRSFLIRSKIQNGQWNQNDFVPSMCFEQQIRCKHGARKGLHLQNLDEMAHRNEHAAAEERRQKKKEKTAARKGGKKAVAQSDEAEDEFENFEVEKKNKTLPVDGEDDWDEQEEGEEDVHDETVLPDPRETKEKMMKHVDSFRGYLKTIRGGQPTVEMFDDILVRDAYGRGTGDVSLKAVAQIVFSAPTLASATCFDPSTAKAVATAIRDQLDLNPIEEEGTGAIKIPIPRVSMEVRQQLVGNIHKRAEQFRIRIRNHRRSALEVVKKGVAGKLEGISKDDAFRVQQEIEALTDVVIKELNKVLEKKEQDILSV